jgi:hypothetical protein
MLTPKEEEYLKNQAYIPEHLPEYGGVISQTEPLLEDDFLFYAGKGFLIFVAYPLSKKFIKKEAEKILHKMIKRFQPAQVAILGPEIPLARVNLVQEDAYFKLDLANLSIPGKVKNMIKRAHKEIQVEMSREFKDEHQQLINEFLHTHPLDEATKYIYQRIPRYLAATSSAYLFNARNGPGNLVAFDVAEFGAQAYAFYMFNFRSTRYHVPGTSDLLLHSIIKEAQERGKTFINLGLGINGGVTFFKKKWGGVPFLQYKYTVFHPDYPRSLEGLWQKM